MRINLKRIINSTSLNEYDYRNLRSYHIPGMGDIVASNKPTSTLLTQLSDPKYGLGVNATLSIVSNDQKEIEKTHQTVAGFCKLKTCYLSWVDFSVPTTQTMIEGALVLRDWLSKGEKPLVHCLWGWGRTGTLLGTLYIMASIEEAVKNNTLNKIKDSLNTPWNKTGNIVPIWPNNKHGLASDASTLSQQYTPLFDMHIEKDGVHKVSAYRKQKGSSNFDETEATKRNIQISQLAMQTFTFIRFGGTACLPAIETIDQLCSLDTIAKKLIEDYEEHVRSNPSASKSVPWDHLKGLPTFNPKPKKSFWLRIQAAFSYIWQTVCSIFLYAVRRVASLFTHKATLSPTPLVPRFSQKMQTVYAQHQTPPCYRQAYDSAQDLQQQCVTQ